MAMLASRQLLLSTSVSPTDTALLQLTYAFSTYAEPLIYAEKQARMLETVTLDSSAGDSASNGNMLAELFDLSLMRFQQRDDIAEAFRRCSRKVGSCHATAVLVLMRLALPVCTASVVISQVKQSKSCLSVQTKQVMCHCAGSLRHAQSLGCPQQEVLRAQI